MVVVGLSYCVVIVAVIVATESLVADVAENQKSGADHGYTAFSGEIQNVVAEDGSYEDESYANQAIAEYAKVTVSTTSQTQCDQAGGKYEPEQNCMKSSVAQKCCGENRESDDCDGYHQTVNSTRCGDEDRCFVAE